MRENLSLLSGGKTLASSPADIWRRIFDLGWESYSMAFDMEKRSLPWDLVEEILSRVPAKSVARFRSTSKQWNALLKSGNFAKKHSANAPKESVIIMLIHSRVYLMRINLHGIHDNVAPSVKVAAQFDLKDPLSSSSQVDICKVFHCDELFLCATKDNRLVVWNPCSGETKWVKPRDSYEESYYYALGYDNKSSCKQYKILRVDCPRFQKDNEYEIYDFTSDSWRVGVTNHWYLPNRRGISVKGNTYWIALNITQGQLEPSLDPYFLLSFDFSTEKFQRQSSLPHPFRYKFAALSLIREEQLCLLGANYDARSSDLHVWVTTSTGPVMSWIKFLTVEDKSTSFFNMNRSYGFSFLADVQNNALMCCNKYCAPGDKKLHILAEDKHVKHVVYHGGDLRSRSDHLFILNYVPSLAQIQQGTPLGD